MAKPIKIIVILISVMLTTGALLALPQSPQDMDGDHTDWTNDSTVACFLDAGGVNDSNLKRADITEYCLHIDSSQTGGLYLLMAVDDTEPKGADVRIVLDVNGDQTPDYSVENILDYTNNDGLFIHGVSVSQCGDATCSLNSLNVLCDNSGATLCSGTAEGYNNNWPSQFTSASNKCDGVDCVTDDGFIEMFVPWQWLGGSPPASYIFALYYSAHSNGTEDTSTDSSGQGIGCNSSGCYTSTPTAITLQSFSGFSDGGLNVWVGGFFLLALVLSSGYLVGRRFTVPKVST